jgi:hypothetical protein
MANTSIYLGTKLFIDQLHYFLEQFIQASNLVYDRIPFALTARQHFTRNVSKPVCHD